LKKWVKISSMIFVLMAVLLNGEEKSEENEKESENKKTT